VAEGFQVNVAMLPAGDDPDNFIRKFGGAAYQDRLRTSRPYLEYLLDQTAGRHDFSKDESRREFLNAMLTVAARIPDAAARDQFADRLAHKARITEEVVRQEIRKAAVQRQIVVETRRLPAVGQIKPAEKGLIWGIMKDSAAALEALGELDEADLEGLPAAGILRQARSLQGWPVDSVPETLMERLSRGEAGLVEEICRQGSPPAAAPDCVRAIKKIRVDRELADVQRELDRLQELGPSADGARIDAVLVKKQSLLARRESLIEVESRS
jgi:DNA primase